MLAPPSTARLAASPALSGAAALQHTHLLPIIGAAAAAGLGGGYGVALAAVG